MTWFRRKKGQNVAEYAILIALVVGAIIAMQKFAQRGLQARVRDVTQYMVDATPELGSVAQYEPYYQDSSYTTNKVDTETKEGTATSEMYNTVSSVNRDGGSNTLMGDYSGGIGNGIKFTGVGLP